MLPEERDRIVDALEWTITDGRGTPRQYVLKNQFMVMEILRNNNWERPVYFAVTIGPDSYVGSARLLPVGRVGLEIGSGQIRFSRRSAHRHCKGHHVHQCDGGLPMGRHGPRGGDLHGRKQPPDGDQHPTADDQPRRGICAGWRRRPWIGRVESHVGGHAF